MRHRIAKAKFGLRFALVVVVLGAVAAGGATLQSSSASSPVRYDTAAFAAPATIVSGAAQSETLKISNSSQSNQVLGSANVTIPAGYTVTAPSTATGSNHHGWRISVSGGLIQLRSGEFAGDNDDGMRPGESLSVTLTVRAPCASGSSTWTVEARQSSDFSGLAANDFVPQAAQPALTLTGTCSFRFATIPTETAGTPFGVAVTTLDGGGVNTATSFNGAATLSGLSASHGAPSYDALNFANGVATGNVTAFAAGTGNTLNATSGSITGTSNPFAVNPGDPAVLKFDQQPSKTARSVAIAPPITVDQFDAWGNPANLPGQERNVTLSIGNDAGASGSTTTPLGGTVTQTSSAGVATFGDIALNRSGVGFTLVASAAGLTSDTSQPFDVLDAICAQGVVDCAQSNVDNNTKADVSYPTSTGGQTQLLFSPTGQSFTCGGSTKPAIGAWVTIQPAAGYTAANPLTVTLTYSKSVAPGTGVSNFVLCISKDGGSTFTVVKNCPKHDDDDDGWKHDKTQKLTDANLPCTISRHRTGVGDLVFVMLMTSTDPIPASH